MDIQRPGTIWDQPVPLRCRRCTGRSADNHRDTEITELCGLCVSVVLCFYPLYRILQIRFPPSSETSTEPSGVTVTPTGLPHLLFFSGSTTKPVRKSSIIPGFPLWKGTKMTFAPFVVERFQDPCNATNNPLR